MKSTIDPTSWLKGTPAAALYAGVSERLIHEWMTKGILTPTRAGARLLFFKREDIDAAILKLAELYEARV